MVNAGEIQDIVAVQNDLALQFIGVLTDLVVLDHNDHQVAGIQEIIQVMYLIRHNVLGDERIIDLQRGRQMFLLAFQKLQGRTVAHIIDVFLIGQSVQTYAACIRQAVFVHNLPDAVEYECRHTVIGLHGFVDHLRQGRIIADQEPRVNGNAVSADTRAGLKDVYAGMHVTDTDDFIYIHIVMPADLRQFVGESDVHSAEGVFHDLGHFSCTDIRHGDFALAEGGVQITNHIAHMVVIRADGAVVMQELINHITGDDPLRSMNQPDIFPALFLQDGAYALVNRAGADRTFDTAATT